MKRIVAIEDLAAAGYAVKAIDGVQAGPHGRTVVSG
jgi:hypothetical protein